MKRIKWAFLYALSGAIVFWTPDILLHAIARYDFSGVHSCVITILLPPLTLAGVLTLWKLPPPEQHQLIAPLMLVGIWLSGGLAMTVAATFTGGGFAVEEGRQGLWLGAIPPFTLMMASYDGALFALLITSFCLVVLFIVGIARPQVSIGHRLVSIMASIALLLGVVIIVLPRYFFKEVADTQEMGYDKFEELQELAVLVKIDYWRKSPKAPLYLQGEPSVALLAKMDKFFTRQGAEKNVRSMPYLYCNLAPTDWRALRQQNPATYPIIWDPQPDAKGRRTVVMVNLNNDAFEVKLVTEVVFAKTIERMESIIRNETGDNSFTLRDKGHP